jgi:hypothetical protein
MTPATFVMCTAASGPWDDRRPAGVLHAAPDTASTAHTTYCGRSVGLFWFTHVDWHADLAGERCEVCRRHVAGIARRRPGPPPAARAGVARGAGPPAGTAVASAVSAAAPASAVA